MQILNYNSTSAPPTLLVSTDGVIESIELLQGNQVEYRLENQHCVGEITDSNLHHSCSNKTTPYCPTHDSFWQCAVCRGDCNKPLDACHEEHAVYLAAFAPETFKVGVTRIWRLETRLKEQGADKAAHIRTVSDGKQAREIESNIATTIPDRIRTADKIESLHTTVNTDAWESLLEDFTVHETFDFDYGFDLSQQPLPQTFLSGEIIGVKGRHLLLDQSKTTYAVDLKSLLGYELTPTSPDRTLQSSFSSF